MSAVRTGATSAPEDPVTGDVGDGQPPEAADASGADASGAAPAPAKPDRRWLVAGVATAALALPFAVAVVSLRRPHWFPVLDLAMTELRLRDVGTGDTTLIGLPGRIGPSLAEQGSHPGPLSFYLLTPFYRVFGSSAWAMLAATSVLSVAAVGSALALAARRGGTRLVVAVAALLGLVVMGYGLTTLTQPWNPYLPLLWWVVFLLAVWSVLCGDVVILPVVVAAGSMCAQTHVPYLGLVGGFVLVVAGATVLAWRAAGPGSAADDGGGERRRIVRWGAAAVALGVLLWLPPVVDQLAEDPGNLRAIVDHMADPQTGDEPVGGRRAARLLLTHLDVSRLVPESEGEWLDSSGQVDGSLAPGAAFGAVWLVAAVLALRYGSRSLVRLHVVVGAGLALGFVAMARIVGKDWYYLMLWMWAILALMSLATAWTALSVARRRLGDGLGHRLTGVAVAGLGVGALASVVGLVLVADDADPPEPHLSETLGQLLPGTISALEEGEGAATGPDGRYVVRWDDAYYFGSQGYGLISELERAGLDAGAPATWHVPITEQRVIEPAAATAALHLATGIYVEEWREVDDAVEVAYVDPRDAAEVAEYEELRDLVERDLLANDQDDLVPYLETNLFKLSIDERISDTAEAWTARMLVIGQPTAVFVTPPETTLPEQP